MRRTSRRAFLRASAAAAATLALPSGFVLADEGPGVAFYEPGSGSYERHRLAFNQRIDRKPAVIAVCTNETGVKHAIARAREQALAVAVKSGGHSFEGFCLNDGGMVVDLAPMNRVRLMPESNELLAQPAATLAEVFDVLIPAARIVPTGSCGGVGIGGLTLGGGYGMFSRELGLTCDSLLGVRMIDGRGHLRISEKRPELLWACRGGGNGNFGVVTRLKFRTHSAPTAFTTWRFKVRGLDGRRAARLAEAWFAVGAGLPRRAFSAFVLNRSTLTVLVTATGDVDAVGRALRPLETAADQRASPRTAPFGLDVVRRYFGRAEPLPFKNVSAGYYQGFDDIRSVATSVFDHVGQSRGMIFQVNTLGGAIADAGDATSSAYPHRERAFLGELQTYWTRPAEAPAAIEAVRTVQRMLGAAGVRERNRSGGLRRRPPPHRAEPGGAPPPTRSRCSRRAQSRALAGYSAAASPRQDR